MSISFETRKAIIESSESNKELAERYGISRQMVLYYRKNRKPFTVLEQARRAVKFHKERIKELRWSIKWATKEGRLGSGDLNANGRYGPSREDYYTVTYFEWCILEHKKYLAKAYERITVGERMERQKQDRNKFWESMCANAP